MMVDCKIGLLLVDRSKSRFSYFYNRSPSTAIIPYFKHFSKLVSDRLDFDDNEIGRDISTEEIYEAKFGQKQIPPKKPRQ
ncbi:hypothetical protein HZS_1728 [Henneguya salminicola]|nr:hypothetical protein HZS_1728 [Henneguya salminicola]